MSLTLEASPVRCRSSCWRSLRDLDRGETLTIQASDQAFPEDAQAWCRKTGKELVALREVDSFFEATVRKS
jgi:TusA-related sulfurtransferase